MISLVLSEIFERRRLSRSSRLMRAHAAFATSQRDQFFQKKKKKPSLASVAARPAGWDWGAMHVRTPWQRAWLRENDSAAYSRGSQQLIFKPVPPTSRSTFASGSGLIPYRCISVNRKQAWQERLFWSAFVPFTGLFNCASMRRSGGAKKKLDSWETLCGDKRTPRRKGNRYPWM